MRSHGMNDTSLMLVSIVLILLLTLQRIQHVQWSHNLGLLIAINSCVSLVKANLNSMGDVDGLPVLLSVTVIVTLVNDIVANGME